MINDKAKILVLLDFFFKGKVLAATFFVVLLSTEII
jgi:hypothetical protein